jgi:hypothetical protein
MFFLIVLLVSVLVFEIAAMRWGYDSRDKLESKEWERRCEQVWSKGHLAVQPIKREQPRNVTRPSLNHAHAFQS